MKKTLILILAILILTSFSGCGSKVNIDDLISAHELPEYNDEVNIEITESEDTSADGEVIVIDD